MNTAVAGAVLQGIQDAVAKLAPGGASLTLRYRKRIVDFDRALFMVERGRMVEAIVRDGQRNFVTSICLRPRIES